MTRVVIIGAGVIGAALACRLARAGAAVTVVEAGVPAAGASGRSFGWINASFFAGDDHFHLRMAGIAAWRALEHDLGGDIAGWTGCLWWESDGAAFDLQAQALARLGYPCRVLDRAGFVALAQHLANPPARSLLLGAEAAVDAAAATARLLADAAAHGAQLWLGVPVTGLVAAGDAVAGVRVPGGVLPADRVIIAAGTASAALLAPLGLHLPLLPRPGLLLHTAPAAPMIGHVMVSPEMEFRQDRAGRLIAPTAAGHQADAAATLAALPSELADAALARLRHHLPDAPGWQMVTLAMRPVPGDGLPLIGAIPGVAGLHLAVMHSGVTLAAVTAELLAAEVMGGAAAPLLAPFRPERLVVQV